MQLAFILYVLACIIVISGTFYFNRQAGKQLTSVVTPVLFLATAIFFGMRWFNTSGDATITTNLSPTWPPPNFINVCPDFLSLDSYDDGNGNTVYDCVDVLGISRVGSPPATVFTLGSVPNNTNNGVQRSSKLIDDVGELCRSCSALGYTWEGVCEPGGGVIIAPGKLPKPV